MIIQAQIILKPTKKSDRTSDKNGQRPSPKSDEYDRFERLMRGLLKVPKKAIREERDKKSH